VTLAPTVRVFGVPVPIGGVVGVPVATRIGRVDHRGIVTDRYGADGEPTILHASDLYGHVVETTATEFVQKAVGPVRFVSYPGGLPPGEVLHRARAKLGTKYRALTANCEHFTTGVHGLPPDSPQIRGWAALGVLSAVAVGAIVVAATADRWA
jgi:hypothetical protein